MLYTYDTEVERAAADLVKGRIGTREYTDTVLRSARRNMEYAGVGKLEKSLGSDPRALEVRVLPPVPTREGDGNRHTSEA